MKVEFNRKRLIAALRKSKEDALAMHRRETKLYHEKLEKAQLRHIENVEAYLKRISNGHPDEIEKYHLSDRLFKGAEMPSKPPVPKLDYVEGLIQQLELIDTESVTCDTREEYVQLTRACAVLGTCKA